MRSDGCMVKVGDLVRYCTPEYCTPETKSTNGSIGLVIKRNDSHRQQYMSVLFENGVRKRIWEGHLEVVNESR